MTLQERLPLVNASRKPTYREHYKKMYLARTQQESLPFENKKESFYLYNLRESLHHEATTRRLTFRIYYKQEKHSRTLYESLPLKNTTKKYTALRHYKKV